MTINPFHPDNLDPIGKAVTILKGDLPGHPFRGNQYHEGQSTYHEQAGQDHEAQAHFANLAGNQQAEKLHSLAAQAHWKASQLHDDVVAGVAQPAEAEKASAVAEAASKEAHGHG